MLGNLGQGSRKIIPCPLRYREKWICVVEFSITHMQNLVASTPKRIAAVIEAQAVHTAS